MSQPNENPDTRMTRAQVDETIVEPARRGLRKFGTGLGTVASTVVLGFGVAGSAFGGLLMGLATGFFAGVGAFFLAGGITAIAAGAFGLFAVRRVDSNADVRAVERRLMKILHAEKRVTDEVAARRIGVDVRTIRETADRLVRAGVIDVDVDPQTGEDVYTLEAQRQLETSVPPAEAAEMAGFDARLRQAAASAGAQPESARQTVRQPAEVEVER